MALLAQPEASTTQENVRNVIALARLALALLRMIVPSVLLVLMHSMADVYRRMRTVFAKAPN
jgi:hypothetical protein